MPENTLPTEPHQDKPSPLTEIFVELAKEAHDCLTRGVKISKTKHQLGAEDAWAPELEQIISFCAENPSENFPYISFQPSATTKEEVEANRSKYAMYFLKYVKNYYWGRRPLARPNVSTITDPALGIVMKKAFAIKDEEIERLLEAHRRCMVVENAVGQLLERYIAMKSVNGDGFGAQARL